jgi:hypothetical protein
MDISGQAVIVHHDLPGQAIKVLRCGNAQCTAGNTYATPASGEIWPIGHTSLALAGGTTGVFTYYDSGPNDLKFIHCGNATCGAPTTRPLDSGPTNVVGIFASVALNSSGNPVIAYYTEPIDILKLIICNNPTCASYSHHVVDSDAITGQFVSLALDAAGFPVMSYYDYSDSDLRVVHCGNATCSAGNTYKMLDGTFADVGKYTSLRLDASGNPVISYYNETNKDLRVARCSDPVCTSVSIASPDFAGDVGEYTSLALDAAGNPVVSYYSASATALKVLHCGNATCTGGNTVTTPDNTEAVGQHTSIALDAAGYPVISYFNATDLKLSVLHCGDPVCAGTSSPVGGLTELADVPAESTGASLLPLASAIAAVAAVLGGLVWRRRPRSS